MILLKKFWFRADSQSRPTETPAIPHVFVGRFCEPAAFSAESFVETLTVLTGGDERRGNFRIYSGE